MEQAVMELEPMEGLGERTPVVHYFDKNGALRSARMVRKIERGKQQGAVVVRDFQGNQFIPENIRNIE